MADFEKLGFEVEVKGADIAVSHLKDIEERLKRIQNLQGGGGFGTKKGGGLSKAFESWSKTGELTKKVYKWNRQEGNLKVYNSAKKNVQVMQELNHAYYEQERKVYLLNQAKRKEIDNRLKVELGLKEETNSWSKYLAKLTSVVVIARRLGRFISSAIQESANYVENLNLFAVAYGDVYEETLDWALNLADGFGFASNEVIKFAGTFRQLSTSLGLVEDTANSVSKTVTQLGYDMSALFNTSVENAMEKLQSGLFSGNVRPLRSYGIDISQNQIDALFETNQALASLGVNARNLSQSDKVLARLIITLRDGSNAFGTMNREINTLQSQIRIFQGSLSNFKLAIGDLLYEPVRQALVVVNALIIAATNLIRVIAPIKKTDENAFNGLAMGAENANEEIDELNGKLADFDKFNVLGGQSQGALTNDAITQALTEELAKQQEYYAQQVALMDDIENEAKELAEALEPVVLFMSAMAVVWTVNKIATTKSFMDNLSKGVANLTGTVVNLNKGISWTSVLLVTGIIYAIVKAIEAFKEGDYWAGALAVVIAGGLTYAWIKLNKEMIKTMGLKIGKFFTTLIADFKKMEFGASGLLYSFGALTLGLSMFMSNFDDMSNVEKAIGIFGALAGALTGVAIAFHATHNWAKALMVGATVAGGMLMVSSITSQLDGFADGGYSNANLIMTHENGKREWVGKAAGSSAIVNDTQMSDIMEVAVAKGVYNALSARSAMGGNVPTNETIVVKIGEEAVFNAVRKTARRQGKDFATV